LCFFLIDWQYDVKEGKKQNSIFFWESDLKKRCNFKIISSVFLKGPNKRRRWRRRRRRKLVEISLYFFLNFLLWYFSPKNMCSNMVFCWYISLYIYHSLSTLFVVSKKINKLAHFICFYHLIIIYYYFKVFLL